MKSPLQTPQKSSEQMNKKTAEIIFDLATNLPQFGKNLRLYNRNQEDECTEQLHKINKKKDSKIINKFSSTVSNSFNKFQSCCQVHYRNEDNSKFRTIKKLNDRVVTEALYTEASLQNYQLQKRKGNSVIIPTLEKALKTWKKRSITVHRKSRQQQKLSNQKIQLNFDTHKTKKKFMSMTQNTEYDQQDANQPKITVNLVDKHFKKTQQGSNFINVSNDLQKHARKISIRSISRNSEKEKDQLIKVDHNYKNNARSVEKQFNTNVNGLNSSEAQNWLNQVLLQYCTDQKFDATIQNSALKKFRIDKNSLLSQGLSPENLQRIYKSLFVYSLGFNNFLKHVAIGKNKKQNFSIRKSLWKVFAILLEYCGEGSFQATLAEIERDKRRYTEYLKDQLQKKQYLIDNNDQINQQKNSKIFKEQKLLKTMNQQLVIQKAILEQDLRLMEVGFNHEVQLRLKFQTKINQLHGVYRELLEKHASLYQQHKKTLESIEGQKYDLQLRSDESAQNQIIMSALRSEISRLKEQIKVLQKEGKETRDRKKMVTKQLYQVQTENQKLQQIQNLHAKNTQGIILKIKTYQQQMDRLQRKQVNTLEQNVQSLHQIRNLQQTIEKQTIQINHLLERQKNFNMDVADVKAELVYLRRRTGEQKMQIDQKKAVIGNYEQEIIVLRNQIEVQRKVNKQIMEVNASLKKCAQQTKLLVQKIQAETTGDIQKYQVLQKQFLSQADQIKRLRIRVQQLEFQNSDQKMKEISLISQISSLQTKLAKDKQVSNKITSKQTKERESSNVIIQQMIQRINILENQVTQYKEGMNKAHKNFVEERFEKGNIDLKYKQTLSVIQSQQKHIKQLKRNISQMQEEHTQIKLFEQVKKRQLQYLQVQINRKIQRYEKQNAMVKEKMSQKKSYYHPLDFQDLYTRFYDLNQKHKYALASFQDFKLVKKQQIQTLQTQLEQSITKFNALSKNSKKDIETLIESLKVEHLTSQQQHKKNEQNQLKKNEQIKKLNDQLDHLKTQRNQIKKTLQEKTKQSKQLLIDLESAHDSITNLKANYARYEQRVKQKDRLIKELQDKVAVLETQKQNIQKALIIIQSSGPEKPSRFSEKKHSARDQSSRQSNVVLSGKSMKQEKQDQNDTKKQQQHKILLADDHVSASSKEALDFSREQFKKKYKRAFDYYHK